MNSRKRNGIKIEVERRKSQKEKERLEDRSMTRDGAATGAAAESIDRRQKCSLGVEIHASPVACH